MSVSVDLLLGAARPDATATHVLARSSTGYTTNLPVADLPPVGDTAELAPGSFTHAPAGERHWHGAAPHASMTHLAITEPRDGKSVQWMEQVRDELEAQGIVDIKVGAGFVRRQGAVLNWYNP